MFVLCGFNALHMFKTMISFLVFCLQEVTFLVSLSRILMNISRLNRSKFSLDLCCFIHIFSLQDFNYKGMLNSI